MKNQLDISNQTVFKCIKGCIKLIFVFVVISTFSTKAYCQLSKKQWLVGGSLNGRYHQVSEMEPFYGVPALQNESQVAFNCPIGIGFFVKNKWAVGIVGFYSLDRREVSQLYENVNYEKQLTEEFTQFGYGIFSRYYFLPIKHSFNLYTSVGLNAGRANYLIVSDDINIATQDLLSNATISLAPVYFINKNVAVEFIVSYVANISNNLQYSMLFGIGLQAHLGK
jgi:hypothetical protein